MLKTEVVEQPAVAQPVVEAPAQTNAVDAEADFTKGFDKVQGDKPSPATKTEEKKPEPKAEDKSANALAGEKTAAGTDAPAAAAAATPETPAKPAVLIAGMTEDELKAALAKSGQLEQHVATEVRKAFSKIGEINRTVQELSKGLSAGGKGRKITADLLKRVNEELPGLGDALAQDLSEILGGAAEAQVTAEGKGQPFDPEVWQKEKLAPALAAMEARIAQVGEDAQHELILFMHGDFDTVVKMPEFKTWLETLPAERQKTVVESPRAVVAGAAVTEFKEWKAKAEKAAAKNKNRLESAITPQGGGAPPGPPQKDEEADFSAGFNKAAKKKA